MEEEKKYLDYEGLQTYHENLRTVLGESELATAEALDDLDDRLKVIEDKSPYSKSEIDLLLTPITNKLENIEEFAEVNVQSDWNLTDTTADDYIKNKPGVGVANGLATLDSSGKVPSSQLPSYVDDVLEYNTKSAFPTTGEAGKIYVDKSTNTTWRWSGTTYSQIKGDLVIGTTSGTAADGGTASAHYSNTSNPHSVTKSQVGLGNVVNTGDSATPVSGGTTKFTTGGAYTELNKKVDKVTGKGLSTNDYTTEEKNKLAGIAAGAEVNVQSDWNATSGDAFIKNKPTTISGYGISDAYTKSETYTKTEVNGLVDTPHQDYVTVATYASLPASGSKDTIYRVSNYNGSTSQVDASVYSEYAWNGSQYVFLCVKSQIGEVFDISVYNNNAKYADLAAALNGGANIPQSLQKGGMSVKFVQSSDNKYVQFRLMNTTFSTNESDWQGVDDEPVAGSDNLVKSGGVKKALDDIVRTVDGTIYVKYEQGGLVDGKIPQTTVLSRVRTDSFIDTENKNLKVYIPEGILLYEVNAYSSADEDEFVIDHTVNKAIEYDLNVNVYARYIKLVFRKPDNSDISPADVEGVIIKNIDNLDARVKALEDVTIDETPSPSSPNPVSSGGVYTALEGKVNVVSGKQLSTNDFTNEDKKVLDSAPATYLKKKKEYSEISVDIAESFWININDTTSAEVTGRQYCGIPVTAGDKYKVSCYNHNSSFPGCRVSKQNNTNEFYIRESTAGSHVDVEITINNSGTMYLNGLEGSQTIVVKKYVSQSDEDFYEEIATVEGKVAEIEDKELRSAKYYAKHVGDKNIEIYFKGYDAGKDLCLKIKGSINVNNILNFYSWEKIDNNTGIVATDWRGGVSTDITSTKSDLVSAWFVRAVNNGDGDLVLEPNEFHPTGGWHGYDSATQSGEGVTPTGRTVWYKVIADDKEVASGNGAYCKKVVVQWCNRVQACNTEKADGTGREVIEEVITAIFNEGMKVKVCVEAKALEDVIVQHHYGINAYNATSLNGDVFFVGDNITPIGKDETGITSTDKNSCNEIMFRGTNDTFVLHIDEHSCGNWKYCTNDIANARYGIPARKAYFRCIETPDDAPIAFAQGGLVYVKGYYNCYPTKFTTLLL